MEPRINKTWELQGDLQFREGSGDRAFQRRAKEYVFQRKARKESGKDSQIRDTCQGTPGLQFLWAIANSRWYKYYYGYLTNIG